MQAYSSKIFDCDTHLYEQPDAWLRYLPNALKAEWGTEYRYGPDGEYASTSANDRSLFAMAT
jgi:hypothetical protein